MTVIDKEVLVVHGGLSPSVELEKVAKIPRQVYKTIEGVPDCVKKAGGFDPETGMKNDDWKLLMDILWSDPAEPPFAGTQKNSARGAGVQWGADITEKWLNRCARHAARSVRREVFRRPSSVLRFSR